MKETTNQPGVQPTVVIPVVIPAVVDEYRRILDFCENQKNSGNATCKSMRKIWMDFAIGHPNIPSDAGFARGRKQSDPLIKEITSPKYFDDLDKLTIAFTELSSNAEEGEVREEVEKSKLLVDAFILRAKVFGPQRVMKRGIQGETQEEPVDERTGIELKDMDPKAKYNGEGDGPSY